MLPLRHHRRLLAWATLLALVLATLAPGVARAVAFVQGDALALAEVCSAYAQAPTAGSGEAGRDGAQPLKHCPYCALHADTLALPPTEAPPMAAAPLSHAMPAAWLHAPRPLFAWAAAQARAPPLAG